MIQALAEAMTYTLCWQRTRRFPDVPGLEKANKTSPNGSDRQKNSCYSVANNVCWGFWTAFLDSVMNMNKPQRHAVNAYRFYMGYWCIQNYNHRLGNIQQDNLHTIIHHSFVSIHHPSVPLWNGTSLKVFWYIHHSLQTLCTAASAGAFAGGRANLSESSPWTLEISWVAVFFFQK